MDKADRHLQDRFKQLNRRGQLLWLAPASPWLLALGFALRITQVTADWKREQAAREGNG